MELKFIAFKISGSQPSSQLSPVAPCYPPYLLPDPNLLTAATTTVTTVNNRRIAVEPSPINSTTPETRSKTPQPTSSDSQSSESPSKESKTTKGYSIEELLKPTKKKRENSEDDEKGIYFYFICFFYENESIPYYETNE